MVASIGTHGVTAYGGDDLPPPAAVVMAYTAHSDHSPADPPTFVVVGENDGISPPSAMERRVAALRQGGVEVEYHKYRKSRSRLRSRQRNQCGGMARRRDAILGKVHAEKALTVSTPRMQPLRQCGSKHHSGAARSHSYGQKMRRRRKLYFMDPEACRGRSCRGLPE